MALVLASLDAYGWDGPWRERRGFDSLVQISCGIAAAGARASGRDAPRPLPAQALDHGTGLLLAAAVVRALTRRQTQQQVTRIRASLLGTANFLMRQAVPADSDFEPPRWTAADTEPAPTAWGAARRVPIPGHIAGYTAFLPEPAGPLGRHDPIWRDEPPR